MFVRGDGVILVRLQCLTSGFAPSDLMTLHRHIERCHIFI